MIAYQFHDDAIIVTNDGHPFNQSMTVGFLVKKTRANRNGVIIRAELEASVSNTIDCLVHQSVEANRADDVCNFNF
jgi:hypothetical protein